VFLVLLVPKVALAVQAREDLKVPQENREKEVFKE